MPATVPTALARRCHRVTGESHERIMRRLAGASHPVLPDASPAQAELEYSVLMRIGDRGMTDGHGWKPGDPPFGVSWLSPYPDALDIGVSPEALPDVLGALMPTTTPDCEPGGVWGLRAYLSADGVQLRRIGLPGVIRLPGVGQALWWRAATTYLQTHDEPERMRLLWLTHPARMHPEEETYAHKYGAGYTHNPRRRELAPLASALLRRHLVFRTPPTAAVDLWQNPQRIELEWADGPTHRNVIDALLDPALGVPGQTSRTCECPTDDSCWSIELSIAAAPGMILHLRRCRYGWSDYRERFSEQARAARRAAWASAEGSGPETLSAATAPAQNATASA